jgi:hypothetical protein
MENIAKISFVWNKLANKRGLLGFRMFLQTLLFMNVYRQDLFDVESSDY